MDAPMEYKNSRSGLVMLTVAILCAFALGRGLRSVLAVESRLQAKPALDPSGGAPNKPHVSGQTRAESPAIPAKTAPSTPRSAPRARRIVQTLLERLHHNSTPGAVPELTANINRGFLIGWVDAVRHTSSEELDGIAEDLRERICRDHLKPEESIFIGQVFQYAPEVSSMEAFECFFNRFPEEGVPLWTMIDAWANTGLDLVPALQRISMAAVDLRTRQRFEPRDPAGEGKAEDEQ